MADDLLFSGDYTVKVDYKNRINIPKDLRVVMDHQQKGINSCYVSRYGKPNEGCYTVIVPRMISENENQLPLFYFKELDKQHRIVLPDSTLIGQMARIIGDGDKFLIQKINKEQNQEK
jgi:DNA-binding transcriptional regulator/RsmH inhibitor MraZ